MLRMIWLALSRRRLLPPLLGAVVGVATVSAVFLLVTTLAGRSSRTRSWSQEPRSTRPTARAAHGDSQGIGRQPGVPSHGPDGHTWHHSDQNLRETVLEGLPGQGERLEAMGISREEQARVLREAGVPEDFQSPVMPAWEGVLSDEDVDAVLTYIETFWTPEQRRFQHETPML